MEAFSPREAEEKRLAVVEVLKFRKNGIWSNSDLRVTTNTAVVVVMMRPFDGWPEDLDECVSLILDQYHNLENGVLVQDALVAFEYLYPETYARLTEKGRKKTVLI
jgi:hypothetical protein